MPFQRPNYQDSSTPGELRNRIWRIEGENPNQYAGGGLPSMNFHEEQSVNVLDGEHAEEHLKRTRTLHLNYDPTVDVPLRNPTDDTLIGSSITMQEAYVMLYSLGRLAQNNQDDLDEAAWEAANISSSTSSGSESSESSATSGA